MITSLSDGVAGTNCVVIKRRLPVVESHKTTECVKKKARFHFNNLFKKRITNVSDNSNLRVMQLK